MRAVRHALQSGENAKSACAAPPAGAQVQHVPRGVHDVQTVENARALPHADREAGGNERKATRC